MKGHLDEHGQPCSRHVPTVDALMVWAAIGARISGFHHDSASKLQSMMMALDEATDLLGDQVPDVQRALTQAIVSLRELNGLLTENRALAKAPQRKPSPLAPLLERAAARHSIKLQGELGTDSVMVAPPSIVHALALLCDQTAGPLGARVVDIIVTTDNVNVTIQMTGTPPDKPPPHVNEAIAVAAFLLEREGGGVRCAQRGFVVQLPISSRAVGDKP